MRLTAAEVAAAARRRGRRRRSEHDVRVVHQRLALELVPGACFVALRDQPRRARLRRRGVRGRRGRRDREPTCRRVSSRRGSRDRARRRPGARVDGGRDRGPDRLEHLRVVAITGSTGKTSTKDLTAAAIGAGLVVHAKPGVVQQRDRPPAHGARRRRAHRGARHRDGRPVRRQHRRAVRDRAPVDRRRHQRRARARRAPRRPRRRARGQGRAARSAPAHRCRGRRRRRSGDAEARRARRRAGAAVRERAGSRRSPHALPTRRPAARVDRREDAVGHRDDAPRCAR